MNIRLIVSSLVLVDLIAFFPFSVASADGPVVEDPIHLNEKLGVYVLDAWIWKNNPSGIFEDWNPKVSRP